MTQKAWAIVSKEGQICGDLLHSTLAIYFSPNYAEHNCLYSQGERVKEVLIKFKEEEETYAAKDIGC